MWANNVVTAKPQPSYHELPRFNLISGLSSFLSIYYDITVRSTCRYVVGLVFGFEHLLLVVAVWLQWVIKPVPKRVRLAIARREYLSKQRMAAAAAQNW